MQPWNRKNQEEREQEVLELQEKHDQEVFQLFEANIKLFSENPNKYAELADREWLKREVSRISEDLIRQCNHRAPNLIPEIRLTQQLVIQQLEKGVKTEELKEVVDNVFQSFAERIAAASKRRNTETYYYPSGPNSGNQGSPN